MHTYVLIHGGWHDARCFNPIVPFLEEKGHRVLTPNLPGHGDHLTPFKKISLDTYVEYLSQLLLTLPEPVPVLLVGHSMAGIVIAQVAERLPHRIHALIFLTAFLPRNGQSLFSLAQSQPITAFAQAMQYNPLENTITLPRHTIEFFFPQQKASLCNLKEPLRPFNQSVQLTATHFGKVSKIYIECTQDQILLPNTQKNMYTGVCDKVFSLPCAHDPFYSAPKTLASTLLQCI